MEEIQDILNRSYFAVFYQQTIRLICIMCEEWRMK